MRGGEGENFFSLVIFMTLRYLKFPLEYERGIFPFRSHFYGFRDNEGK
jgi:hypothetical protein